MLLPSDVDTLTKAVGFPFTDVAPEVAARVHLWAAQLLAQHRGEPVPEARRDFTERLLTAYHKDGVIGLVKHATRYEAEKLMRKFEDL